MVFGAERGEVSFPAVPAPSHALRAQKFAEISFYSVIQVLLEYIETFFGSQEFYSLTQDIPLTGIPLARVYCMSVRLSWGVFEAPESILL